MKTILYAPMYLDGVDASGSSRLDRNIKFVEYYRGLKDVLGFQSFFFADNASSPKNLHQLYQGLDLANKKDVFLYGFDKFIDRGQGFDYGYCWRAVYTMRKLILEENVRKIIFLDSDIYILRRRLADYVRSVQNGWVSFWSSKYQFPESGFHILCEDEFDFFLDYTKGDFMEHNGKCMETTLPFTKVIKTFAMDRFGEDRQQQQDSMEGYCQCPVDIKLEFKP